MLGREMAHRHTRGAWGGVGKGSGGMPCNYQEVGSVPGKKGGTEKRLLEVTAGFLEEETLQRKVYV